MEYELFTITLGDEENQTEEDVYQKDGKWYYVSTLGEVSEEDLNGQTPKEKIVPVIVGYEGENRIWEDWRELLEGVNIGGLGTPIASLASLITLKLYMRHPGARVGRFLWIFTLANVIGLALLLAVALVF